MDTVSPHALGLPGNNLVLVAGSPNAASDATRTPAIKRLYRLGQRWRWVLVGGVLAGILLGLLATLLMTPQYVSTVRLEIDREADRVVNIDSVQRDTSIGDQEFYQTQYGLLKTKALAERVARDLRLTDDSEFFATFGRRDVTSTTPPQKRLEAAAQILLDHVNVAPIRGSRLIDVTATTPDPGLSERIARAWGDNFIQTTIERRFNASSFARSFLEKRLAQLRDKLEQSERASVNFAANQGIINLPSAGNDGGAKGTPDRSLVTDDLSALNGSLAAATAQRIEAQSRLIEAGRPDATSEGLSNPAIAQLRQQRAAAAADYSKMMIQFEPGYPPAKAAAAQVAALDSAIAREEGRVRTTLQQEFQSSRARENALLAKVNGLKGSLNDLRRRGIQYNIYQRDADTNRELYNSLLQRYKEIGVAGGVEKNNISVVDPAQVPDRPSSPRLLLNLLFSTLAGGLAGVAAASVLAQMDEGIREPGEVENKLGLPLIGTVPKVRSENPIEALQDPRSPIVESYLAVQTNLELSTAHGVPRSMAVTSTRPREGKSTTTIALAQSLVRSKRRVVLVDADMRAPSIHTSFGLRNDMGVSNFLAGVDNLDGMLQRTDVDGLTIMTAGPQPPNAADLLTGPRLRELIDRLQQRFDHVIVDSPPVIGLADAPLLGAAVEGLIYVLEAKSIQAGMVRAALTRLRASQLNVLGIIVTKLDVRRGAIGYGYAYDYDYAA